MEVNRTALLGRLRTVLGPEALVLAAAVAIAQWPAAREIAHDVVALAPYAVFLGCAVLAWRMKRSRLVFALACLVAAQQTLERAAETWVVGVLLPVNLAAIALLPERGALSRAGLVHGSALGAQVGGALYAVHAELLPAGLAWPVWLAFGVAAVAVGVGRALAPLVTARGYSWALAAAFLAVRGDALERPLFFAAAGSVLALAVLEQSYTLAFHDGLTGLPGRRALDEELARVGGQYAIAMVDVDHFKKFNDTYGHDVGDQVLRVVATRVADSADGGTAFRYGGEEFAILFPGKSVSDCLPVLEGVRRAVADHPFTIRGRLRRMKRPKKAKPAPRRRKQMTITVSIGVAEKTARHAEPEGVIQAADRALYRAKNAGRNRVIG
jgi:diguanylate cyclase (GGDEF)-like protein